MSRGFGFAIDYDKEIAADEEWIAHLTGIAIGVAAEIEIEEREAPGFSWDVFHFVMYRPERVAARAALFGLDLDDLRAMALTCSDRFAVVAQPGDYARGAALAEVWSGCLLLTETERRDRLHKARAALARHRRNSGRS